MDTIGQRVSRPPDRPLMVWDGDCHFCGGWIRRWQTLTGDQIDYQPYQKVGRRFPEISEADYTQAVHLILPDGSVRRAAQAVFTALSYASCFGCGLGLKLYQRSPTFARVTESAYRFVAGHRMFFSRLTRLLWGDPAPSTFRFSGLLFTRALGLIFLVAFISFWGQAGGLVGDHGILPIRDYFAAIAAEPNSTALDHFWNAPSLLWLAPDNTGLLSVLIAGSVCATLAMFGLVPAWALLGCVIAYGSLRNGVPIFLNFQWDALILETGFVALLVAPWGWWQSPFALRDPPKIGRWSAWWLFFKLMFLSGLVKIITNDSGPGPDHPDAFRRFVSWITDVPVGKNTWLDGTALQYHYFTQPIPATTSWWFAHLSPGFQAFSMGLTLFIEILTPFAFFTPRRLRHAAAILQLFLQFMLLATGNYGFFNLLAIALALFLFDDAFWPPRVQRILNRSPAVASSVRSASASIPVDSKLETRNSKLRLPFATWTRGLIAACIFFIGLIQIRESWLMRSRAPDAPTPSFGSFTLWADSLSNDASRLGLVNAYGLFRVMTTERPEIIIEGTNDGVHWLPYEFYWKPGDVMRPPAFTTPHMPRLDWQMWFAALEIYESHGQSIPGWLPQFLYQLQQGNPEVLALLEKNPFPDSPPNQLRLRVFLYTFTSADEHEKTGAWWTHDPDPVLTLTSQAR
jgi:predicted DCC family thiol-disulfide oxidoreductase YuxK